VTAVCGFLALGHRLSDEVAADDRMFQGHRLLLYSTLAIPLIVGGLVAAKLGSPRYLLHAATLGVLSAVLFATIVLVAPGQADTSRLVLTMPLPIAAALLGAWIVRWQERVSR
jgi:hypothetical protein